MSALLSLLWWGQLYRRIKQIFKPSVGHIDLFISQGEVGEPQQGAADRPNLMEAGDPFTLSIQVDDSARTGTEDNSEERIQPKKGDLRVSKSNRWGSGTTRINK